MVTGGGFANNADMTNYGAYTPKVARCLFSCGRQPSYQGCRN